MSEWVVMSEQCESIVLCVTALLTLLLTSSAKNLTLEGTGFFTGLAGCLYNSTKIVNRFDLVHHRLKTNRHASIGLWSELI